MIDEPAAPAALEAYLLGRVDFSSLMSWQKRMVYEVSGERSRGILALCEVPPTITVGRSGSREHILFEDAELWSRGWPIRWVNRGGGCLLHVPGQLQVVAVLAIDSLGLGLTAYLEMLHDILLTACHECDARAEVIPGRPGVWSRDRLLAHVGVAVHDWVAYFGAALNLDPDLDLFRSVRCDGSARPMTSLAREKHAPVRPALIRQRLVELFAERFGFPRTAIFHHHRALTMPAAERAFAYRSA
jgi:lipoyl(octanoyl) transferase